MGKCCYKNCSNDAVVPGVVFARNENGGFFPVKKEESA